MYRWLRKPLAAAVLATALATAAAGCSGGKGEESGGTSVQSKNEPFPITMMNQSIVAEVPAADNPMVKALEDYTNTKLNIQWVPSSNYNEKLNSVIASGSLPMVLLVTERQQSIIQALRGGFFWDITPYLQDYPNLAKAQSKAVRNSLSVDGKTYSLFISLSPVLDSFIYRKDWLDHLGLKPPETLDDIYAVLKAFTQDDPDGDEKNDTVAFAEESGLRGFNFLLAAHGGGNEWDVVDGKLVPTIFSQAYLDTLNFYKKLYDEKLMNQDFAISTRQTNIDKMNQGQIGVRMGAPDQITRQNQLYKSNPKAVLDLTASVNGVKGRRVLMSAGYFGEFMFPKSSVKTEADLRRILEFFDKSSDPGGQTIFQWGVEGTHYTVQDGKAKRTPAQADLYNSLIPVRTMLRISDGKGAMEGAVDPIIAKYTAAQDAVMDDLVLNPASKYISDTMLKKGSDLDQLINDARIKYIMGELNADGWKDALEAWRKAGGDQVIQEMNEQYAKDPDKIKVD
ncbi:extracellular solute-binding protein [Paenibacillus humicola]|uniref:extracellular solute-binding protein n=1 Tax=Paenibacillus humicola TaxID=3110540 RepID=UPI00237AEB8C|nr:extracellular solute-binding protein [Paenibacillus humicola]